MELIVDQLDYCRSANAVWQDADRATLYLVDDSGVYSYVMDILDIKVHPSEIPIVLSSLIWVRDIKASPRDMDEKFYKPYVSYIAMRNLRRLLWLFALLFIYSLYLIVNGVFPVGVQVIVGICQVTALLWFGATYSEIRDEYYKDKLNLQDAITEHLIRKDM